MRPLIAVVGMSLSGLTLADNCTAMPVSGSIYTIVNQGSGRIMEVDDGSTSNGANIQQWTPNGYKNQQFTVTDLGNGSWSIRPVHSNKSVDLYAWSTVDGGTIKQWEYWGGAPQQWKLSRSNTGAIKIASAYTGKLISVADSQIGSDVFQKSDQGSTYQGWYFNPVNGSCGASIASSASTLVGFAAQSGDGLSTTTGGGSTAPIQVTSCDQLVSALNSSSPAVVQIPNTTIDCRTTARVQQACSFTCAKQDPANPSKLFYWVETGSNTCESIKESMKFYEISFKGRVNKTRNERYVVVKSNKTLEGLGANSRVLGASFYLKDVSNIIIRNLAIEQVNPDLIEAGDGISMMNTHHIWLDHLRTSMISDGHVDMYDSRNVTLSWNRFYGANPNVCGGQHAYVNLVSNSQATYHHNYWEKSQARNPYVGGQNSKIHLFNNFWQNITHYAIGAYNFGQVKVEGNYFENSVKPHWNYQNGLIDANISSNVYTGVSATDSYKDTGSTLSWSVPYVYQRDSADKARTDIISQAGPR
ncbi:hypothetical protein BZL41_02545 [Pseudomonas sp. PIC25]|nr:hypothetical protein BZL41_02545 [Pseudomonas sp. PIC25]